MTNCILLFTVFLCSSVATLADLECSANKISEEKCKEELRCSFDEGFDLETPYRCRCKTVISTYPLPDNTLKYDMFKKICFKRPSNVQRLWLNDMGLEEIDNRIFKECENLTDLNLKGNRIRISFPKAALTLLSLDVSYNNLTALPLNMFANLNQLTVLNLSHNLIANISGSLKSLHDLMEIYLNNNQLKVIYEEDIDHMFKLKIINVANNNLYAIESRLQFVHLERFFLQNNSLRSIHEHFFVKLPNLRVLNVSYNEITTLEEIYDFGNLQELYYQNNHVKSLNPELMRKLKNLEILNLSNNSLKMIEHDSFPITNKLKVVDMSINNISRIDHDNFERFNNVTFLNLGRNSLSQNVINCDNLQQLTALNSLDLSHNQISEIYNCTFSNLAKLTKLSLLANKLNKIDPSAFDNLQNLQELNLAKNKIDKVPEGIFDNLINLRELDISQNNIKHFDPNLLSHNKRLTYFDVKDNRFAEHDREFLMSELKCHNDRLNFGQMTNIDCKNKNAIIIAGTSIAGFLALIGLVVICLKICRIKGNSSTSPIIIPMTPNSK